jgi:hypothetical protein
VKSDENGLIEQLGSLDRGGWVRSAESPGTGTRTNRNYLPIPAYQLWLLHGSRDSVAHNLAWNRNSQGLQTYDDVAITRVCVQTPSGPVTYQ